MKKTGLVLVAALAAVVARGDPLDQRCASWRAFVASVQPAEKREFTLHTIWGANFKDTPEPAMHATRCVHHGDDAAKAVCADLLKQGSVEFPQLNVERALECLAPCTRFAKGVHLRQGHFSWTYGAEDRSHRVSLLFGEDLQLGGMALQVIVQGD